MLVFLGPFLNSVVTLVAFSSYLHCFNGILISVVKQCIKCVFGCEYFFVEVYALFGVKLKLSKLKLSVCLMAMRIFLPSFIILVTTNIRDSLKAKCASTSQTDRSRNPPRTMHLCRGCGESQDKSHNRSFASERTMDLLLVMMMMMIMKLMMMMILGPEIHKVLQSNK